MDRTQQATPRKWPEFTAAEVAERDRILAAIPAANAAEQAVLRQQLDTLRTRVAARGPDPMRWGEARDSAARVVETMTPEQEVAFYARDVAYYRKVEAKHAEMRAEGFVIGLNPERQALASAARRRLGDARRKLASRRVPRRGSSRAPRRRARRLRRAVRTLARAPDPPSSDPAPPPTTDATAPLGGAS